MHKIFLWDDPLSYGIDPHTMIWTTGAIPGKLPVKHTYEWGAIPGKLPVKHTYEWDFRNCNKTKGVEKHASLVFFPD